jgi:hypothetical protein
LLLIVVSLMSAMSYHSNLNVSVREIKSRPAQSASPRLTESVLKETPEEEVTRSTLLLLCYLAIFISAEAAFVLMATNEYLLDVLGLHDVDIIVGGRGVSVQTTGRYVVSGRPENSG